MTARKNLEEAIELLLNEDEDNAHVAFHNFIVKAAQGIHESLISEDELDDEIAEEDGSDEVDESVQDEYFGRDELTMENGDEDEDEGMEGPEEMGDDDAEEELGDDEMGDDMEGEEVTLDAGDVADLQTSLQDLQAKFDELTGGGEAGEEMDDDMGAEMGDDMDDMEDMGDMGGEEGEVEDDMEEAFTFESEDDDEDGDELEEAITHDAGVVGAKSGVDPHGKHGSKENVKHNSDAKLPESAEFDFDLTEEDFEDLEEGLKTIDVKMGGEQGAGKFAGEETQTKSPVAQRDKSDVKADAKSMTSKKSEVSGYGLESKTDGAYGESQKMTPHAGDNSHDKAPAGKPVAKGGGLEKQKGYGEGESGAGKFAGTETNVKSPIGSSGTRNG